MTIIRNAQAISFSALKVTDAIFVFVFCKSKAVNLVLLFFLIMEMQYSSDVTYPWLVFL